MRRASSDSRVRRVAGLISIIGGTLFALAAVAAATTSPAQPVPVGTGPVAPGPVITVTPSLELTDGQTVTVTGAGFPADDALVMTECGPHEAGPSCGPAEGTPVTADASGNVTATMVVRARPSPDGGAACSATVAQCSIVVGEPALDAAVQASAPISFGVVARHDPTTTTVLGLMPPTVGTPGTTTTVDTTTSTVPDLPSPTTTVPTAAAAPDPAAAPQGTPSITVTPNSGLKDGQTVTIKGTGFPANDSLAAIQCAPPSIVTTCDTTAAVFVAGDASGNVTASLVVHTGKIGADPTAVCPPPSGNCVIQVGEPSATTQVHAAADITFASSGTTTTTTKGSPTTTTGGTSETGGVSVGAGSSSGSGSGSGTGSGSATGAGTPTGSLPHTGVSTTTWVLAVLGLVLIDLGYLMVSATRPSRRMRRAWETPMG